MSLFSDEIIVYILNLKKSTKELLNKCSSSLQEWDKHTKIYSISNILAMNNEILNTCTDLYTQNVDESNQRKSQ